MSKSGLMERGNEQAHSLSSAHKPCRRHSATSNLDKLISMDVVRMCSEESNENTR